MKLTSHQTNEAGIDDLSHPFILFLGIKSSILKVTQAVILDNLTWHEMMMQWHEFLESSNNLGEKLV